MVPFSYFVDFMGRENDFMFRVLYTNGTFLISKWVEKCYFMGLCDVKKKRATWDAKVAFGDEVCSSMGRKKLPQGRWLRPICISFSSHKNDLPPFWTHWDAYGAYWDNCVFREGALHEGAFLIFYLGLRFSANSATVSIYSFATFWLPWWIITENR